MSDKNIVLVNQETTPLKYRVEIRTHNGEKWLPAGRLILLADAMDRAEVWRANDPETHVRIIVEERVVIDREVVLDEWPKPAKK